MTYSFTAHAPVYISVGLFEVDLVPGPSYLLTVEGDSVSIYNDVTGCFEEIWGPVELEKEPRELLVSHILKNVLVYHTEPKRPAGRSLT